MFVIYVKDKDKFFCKDNKPIAFELFEDAHNFLNDFYNYAMHEAIMSVFERGIGFLQEVRVSLSTTEIRDFDNKSDFYPFEKIKNR